MGLPIWREPEETKPKIKADLTATARSSIRRRPSVHGNRNRSRLVRESTIFGQREHLPVPPPPATVSRYSRRNGRVGVPPISTLLESADRIAPLPPPSISQRIRDFDRTYSGGQSVTDSLQSLHERASRIHQSTQEQLQESNQSIASQTGTRTGDRLREQSRRLPQPGPRGARPTRQNYDRDLRSSRNLPWPPARHGNDRPRSRGETAFSRSTLPTPPLDHTEPEGDSLFLPETNPRTNRPSHPLSRSWNPDSPINGLGDRNRSLTPTEGWDGWEIMQSTITPDETLPSASSSFASNATHESQAPSTDTTITEPQLSGASSEEDGTSDSASSLDVEDFVCHEDEDMISTTAQFARDMYYREMEYPAGHERIAALESQRREEGNRFALASEPQIVDIGFRLIEDALETDEGRGRVYDLQGGPEDEDALQRMVRFRSSAAPYHNLTRHSPQPRARSPPPRYSPFPTQSTSLDAPAGDSHWLTSRSSPQPHAVSPPNDRSRREVDALLMRGGDLDVSGEELSGMRRIIERLARRDDVPDEWWISMGLAPARREALREGRGESRL